MCLRKGALIKLVLDGRSWARGSLRGGFCYVCCFAFLLSIDGYLNCVMAMIFYTLWSTGLYWLVHAVDDAAFEILLLQYSAIGPADTPHTYNSLYSFVYLQTLNCLFWEPYK